MNEKRLIGQIGLCYAAKKMIFGTDMITSALRHNKVRLILISSNSSFNTQKLIQNKAITYKCKVVMISEFKDEILTKALSKNKIVVVGITDNGFAKKILNTIQGE